MLRRNLLKALLAAPLGLLFGKKSEGQDLSPNKELTLDMLVRCKEELDRAEKASYNYVRECLLCHHYCFTKNPEKPICNDCLDCQTLICNTDSSKARWRFYINDEEIDGSRAIDEHGALHWPFQGAKDGDLCTARSPKTSIYNFRTPVI